MAGAAGVVGVVVAVVEVKSGGAEAGATGPPGKVGVPVGGELEDVAVEVVPVAAAPVVGGIVVSACSRSAARSWNSLSS